MLPMVIRRLGDRRTQRMDTVVRGPNSRCERRLLGASHGATVPAQARMLARIGVTRTPTTAARSDQLPVRARPLGHNDQPHRRPGRFGGGVTGG